MPLLDEGVASLAVGLPARFKVRGGQKKIVLRDADARRIASREILDGPKTGFGVPYEEWLRGALHGFARAAILDPQFVERFGFDRTRLERALGEHRSRRRDRGFLLWKLLQLVALVKAIPAVNQPISPEYYSSELFQRPGSQIFGGMVTSCRILLSSSLPQRVDLDLLDSTQISNPPPCSAGASVPRAFRLVRFVRQFERRRPQA